MPQKEIRLEELMGIQAKANVSDQLYQRISNLILYGTLEEGYVFPNETVLCEQLRVGRTTLREAYKALELTGYVTRTKRGTSVNSRSAILNATPLKTIFQTASPKDFNQYRLMLETESAYLAAQNAGMKEIETLDHLIGQSLEAKNRSDYDRLIELDAQFHCAIAKMSQNTLIISMISVITEAWEASIRRNFASAIKNTPRILEDMIDQHIAIREAICVRNCDTARVEMSKHIQDVTDKNYV